MSSSTHAIVIGASMAGLAATAALAPTFGTVTLLDRDLLPTDPADRRGVPQGRHAHGLQPGGLRALEDLLPGLLDDLAAAGAPRGDISAMGTWVVGGHRFAKADGDVDGIGVTRAGLEHAVRQRVLALPNVRMRDGVVVDGLLHAAGRVTGVRLAHDGGTTAELTADLVVDASGRSSRLPAWLTDAGHAAPVEEAVECRMSYLTRRWRLAPGTAADLVTVVTTAEQPHFGVMIDQEDGTHIVTVGGLLDSGPARTDEAYRAFAAALPDPVIAEALQGATPVSELREMHFPASRRRRYDQLRSVPAGVIAIGDSIASFNPMYGQGMSVAALEAVELRSQLAAGPLDPRRFHRAAHRIEDVAWKIVTGGDLRYDGVIGKRTPDQKVMNRYLDRLTLRAATDPELATVFLRVASFIDPPTTFFKPRVLRKVLGRPRAATAANEIRSVMVA